MVIHPFSLAQDMESVSTYNAMALGQGLAKAFAIQAKIYKLCYLKIEHIVASLGC